MKKEILFLVFAAILLSFGCSNERDINNISHNNIISISPYSSNYKSNSSRSKLDSKSLSFSLCYGSEASSDNAFNVKWSNTSDNWTAEKDVYINAGQDHADIYAFSPYIDNLDVNDIEALKSIAFSVDEDQTLAENQKKSDLLSCVSENVSINDFLNKNLVLSFNHRLSLLNLKLSFKDSYKGEKQIEDVKVYAFTDFTFDATNLTSSTLQGEDKKTILPYVVSANSEYTAVIPPQELKDCDLITMKIDGKQYKYSIPTSSKIAFESDKKSILNLLVGNEDVTLGNVSIVDWNKTSISLAHDDSWLDYASENAPSKDGEYYMVKTAAELAWVAKRFNKQNETDATDRLLVKLNNDIDLSAHTWVPINVNNEEYSEFDGNNYKITGMKIHSSEDKIYRGFFGCATNIRIKNLTFVNPSFTAINNVVTIDSKANYEKMGVIAGKLGKSFVSNVHIFNASIIPSKQGATGGFIGVLNDGSAIYASSFNGVISPDASSDIKLIRVGSFCGTMGTSVILGCYSSGEIKKGVTCGFVNAFVGAAVDLPTSKLYLDACYTTANLNGITSNIYVSIKAELSVNVKVNNVTLTAPTNIEELNNYIKSVYTNYDLTIVGGTPKSISLKDNGMDYYIFKENTNETTKELYPYVMEKSVFQE